MAAIQYAVIIGASVFLTWLLVWRIRRMFCPRPSLLDHATIFFGLAFCAMLALRWGRIVFAGELSVDESQMLAQAMRYLSHPVPWRDVDGTTSGPLNSLLLSAVLKCGAPATWVTARLVLLAANCGVMLFIYGSLRFFVTRIEAQFILMPVLCFYAFTTSKDFTHYSSETLSSVLLSAGFYLLAKQWTAGLSKAGLFLLGVLLGAIPFSKLQATPLGLFLGATALALIFYKRPQTGKTRSNQLAEAGALTAGAVLIPVLIVGVVASSGAFDVFWKSYILASRKYAEADHMLASGRLAGQPWLVKRVIFVGYILAYPPNMGMFFLSGLFALAVLWGIYRGKKIRFPVEVARPLAMVMAYGVLTILCFFAAGKPFPHYGALMIPPLALLIGLVFLAGKTTVGLPRAMEVKPELFPARWLLVFAILAIGFQAYEGPLRIYRCIASGPVAPAEWASSVDAIARSASRPGDTLSVWGWMPEYYVRTGLPPATRDAIGHYVITDGPYREYYRNRHLRDLEHSKPAIFIDAVGDGAFVWSQWTVANKHESFPELAKFIDDNYSLLAKLQLSRTVELGPVRIYVLKQRMAELHLAAIAADAPPVTDYPPSEPR